MRHRTALKNRIHATLLAFGKPCPVSDLFGVAGRELLDRLEVPQPWRGTIDASLQLIEDLDGQIRSCERELPPNGLPVSGGFAIRSRTASRKGFAMTDEDQIRAAVLDYIEGWFDGDAVRMERALHPSW